MRKFFTGILKLILRKAGYALVRIQTADFRADTSKEAGGEFRVEYIRHNFNEEAYFVPRYAAHRGAARAISVLVSASTIFASRIWSLFSWMWSATRWPPCAERRQPLPHNVR